MLTNTTSTFVYAIYTFNECSQLIIHTHMVKVSKKLLQFSWLIIYMSLIIIIIYYSTKLTKEVKISKFESLLKNIFRNWMLILSKFQAKRTDRIVHDISNCCDNTDMTQSVKKNWFEKKRSVNFQNPLLNFCLSSFHDYISI